MNQKRYLHFLNHGAYVKEKIFTEDGNYTLNHSSPIILLKDGKYVATIRQQDDIKRSLKKIKKFL